MAETPYENGMAAKRARRRESERRAHLSKEEKADGGRAVDIEALAMAEPGDDPPEFLEARRLALIKTLIIDASETEDRELRARICVNLLKFSSMGRNSLDLIHSLKRDELPDFSKMLTTEQLAALVGASDDTLMALAAGMESGESGKSEARGE